MKKVSILVRVVDSGEKLLALLARIDAVFLNDRSQYEILCPADLLSKTSLEEMKRQAVTFPVRMIYADRDTSSANSTEYLLQTAAYELLAIIHDLDDQIDALPGMVAEFSKPTTTIVVGVKKNRALRSLRNFLISSITTHASNYSTTQLHQSRILVLRKSAYRQIVNLQGVALDNPRLFASLIQFMPAVSWYDVSRPSPPPVGRVRRRYRSAVGSIKKKLVPDHYVEFDAEQTHKRGNGFYYKGAEYITHNTLTRQTSAVERTTLWQRFIIAVMLLVLLLLAVLSGKMLLVAIVTIITLLYFADLLFNLFLIYRSLKSYSEITVSEAAIAADRSWPAYTILCPLYKETLVIPQFTAAMAEIDYPKDKLEVLLLLEEDDRESIEAIQAKELPDYFTLVVVPHSLPKTKPKACNYGLLRATGEYTVIYDAEDIPDPLQLKKAVVAFENSDELIGCIQAKLNYYNWDQNLLTRLFTLEYSLWFNLILTGLQSIKAPIPLGGTSNHFKTDILRDLGGWDPFNVTEDADLGIRLAKRGFKTAVLDSTTLEEANSEFRNWLKQRSRWIKGYMQTYLVHMRDLREFGKNSQHIDMLTFQLVIGGKVLSMLINPILWLLTLTYFVFREQVGPTIESLYLTPVFYVGAISLVLGNFMYLYYYMIGAARRGRPELIIFALFVPFYWIMMSIAAYYALFDLIVRPFHWHKTKHGLHLKKHTEKLS